MAFRFSLETVLAYRLSIEQRESLALDKIVFEMANLKAQQQAAEESNQARLRSRDAQLVEGVQSASLRDTYEQLLVLGKLRELIAKRLQELERKREKQQKEYESARQKREILEQLRRQRHSLYLQRQDKLQQAVLDDLFLSKHIRRQ